MENTSQRSILLGRLAAYRSSDPADAMQAARIVRFVEAEPYCALRSTPAGHLTGSAWVVNGAGTRVLLVHHRKLDKWLQPGGHADGEFDLLAVAMREVQEECGIRNVVPWSSSIFDVDVHEIPARADEAAHLHFDVRFVLLADDSEAPVKNHETRAVEWVDMNRIDSLTREWSVLRMRQKWLDARYDSIRRAINVATAG
jgi:8-oxo-dGTP pyrophosphatase MutT (NUDIX family)